MAFNTKYRILSVSEVFGGIQIDLLKDGYSGSITEFEGVAPNAADLQIGRDSKNIFEPILPSELDCAFYIQDSNFQSLELGTDASFTWLCVVTQQGSANEIWRGWVLPESYGENYTATPYIASFMATDALEDLRAFDYPLTDLGFATLWEMLLECLQGTALGLPIKESVNLYADAMSAGVTDSPLLQAETKQQALTAITEKPTKYDALAAILIPFGARIYQYGGFWRIENIQGKRASYVERTYNSAGVYQSQETINPLKTLSNTEPAFAKFLGQSGQLTTIPNVNQARVFFRTVAGEAVGGIPGFSTEDDWTSATVLANWTKVGSFDILKTGVNYDENALGVTLQGRQTSLGNNYIQSQTFAVQEATFGSLNIGFDFLMNWPSIVILGSKPIFYVEIRLEAGAKTYYWRNDWTEQVQRNPLQSANRLTFERWTTSIASIPEDGNIVVRLYQAVKSGTEGVTRVTVTGWNFEVQATAEVSAAYRSDSGILSFLGNLQPYDLEILFSDGDNVEQPGVLSVGGTLTENWARRGVTESRSFQQLFLLQFLSMHARPTLRIQGALHQRGQQILPFNTIQDDASISTRAYVMGAYRLGLSTGIGDIVYREILTDDASPTFLSELLSIDQFRFEFTQPIQVPFGPGVIPSLPDFDLNLNGDVFGQLGTNTLSKSAIVDKPLLDLSTPIPSSDLVINAVIDETDAQPMTKITALSLFDSWDDKAQPDPEDELTIKDSVSEELRVVKIEDLPIAPSQLLQEGATDGQALVWNDADGKWEAGTVSGSKWTEVANGIYRNGRVAIGTTTVGTTYNFQVIGLSELRGTAQNVFTGSRINVSSAAGSFAAFQLNVVRSGGLANGQGVSMAFIHDDVLTNRLAGISAIKRGANAGELQIYYYNGSSAARVSAIFTRNRGLWIGDLPTNTAEPNVSNDSLRVAGTLRTGNPSGSTSRDWKLGEREPGAVTPDGRLTVEVNGVLYWIPVEEAII